MEDRQSCLSRQARAPVLHIDYVVVVAGGGCVSVEGGGGGAVSVFGGIVLVTGGSGGSMEVAGIVKFEVVSALVPVIPAGDGGASPGALIVEVTPLV
jgi:hypothetical protein